MPKKVFIRTLGCQMNVRDSEFVMGLMMDAGCRRAESVDGADVVIFNSCSVRKHAEDKLFSNIGDLAKLKKERDKVFQHLDPELLEIFLAHHRDLAHIRETEE